MHLNWEAISHFDPSSPGPFAKRGIPIPNYGNYGGANYSAGVIGGHITGTSVDPPPVDTRCALLSARSGVPDFHKPLRTGGRGRSARRGHAWTDLHRSGDAHYDPEAGPLRRNIAWGALA